MRPAVLALALLAACPPIVRSQTVEEVRKVVDDYADFTRAAAAHAALKAWGNAALPALREVARNPPAPPGLLDQLASVSASTPSWEGYLVRAVADVDTAEAIELLIEFLDGKPAVEPYETLTQLERKTYRHREQLYNHQRFQQLVFKFAYDASGPLADINRCAAAHIIANLGWEDGAPLIELMLHAPRNLKLRREAAAALKQLTGRDVEIPPLPLVFPAFDESELLRLTGSVEGHQLRGRFTTWFNGEPALVQARGRKLASLDLGGRELTSADSELDGPVQDVLALPFADGPLWMLVADAGGRDGGSRAGLAVVIDARLGERWRHVPPESAIVEAVPLYGAEGCVGAVIADQHEDMLRGFDHDGKPLFVAGPAPSLGLDSNPALPDTWLHWNRDITVRDNAGRVKAALNTCSWAGPCFCASEAVLFPDDHGRPGVIAAGEDFYSMPTIARYDIEQRIVWRAAVPTPVEKLALLDPPGGRRLVAATTAGGQVLVFDCDGTLRQRLDVPGRASGELGTQVLSAGPMPGHRYGLAIGLPGRTLLYELD